MRYLFGPYELDAGARELRKFGRRIPLQQKPFEALTCLLERPGQVVTRNELRDRLWSNDVYVDFEHNLNRVMNKIRAALSDSAAETKFIETLPGRGYRLIHEQIRSEVGASIASDTPLSPAPIHGALPFHSRYYVERPADGNVQSAVARRDSVVLLKGPRQTGKTSLLARVLEQSRRGGVQTIIIDFQKFNAEHLQSMEAFLLKLTESIAEQAGIEFDFAANWSARRGPSMNFDRFVKRYLLASKRPIVLAIDEADRLFAFPYASEFFGLLRSWHNERALDPGSPCEMLTLIVAYATEADLFISDLNQSPFNVGTLFPVADLTIHEVEELHSRYGNPLKGAQVLDFYQLFGGQPYLSQIGFHEIVARKLSFQELAAAAISEDGPFSRHLRRLLISLQHNLALCQSLRQLLAGQGRIDFDAFYRLRSAGIIRGDSPLDAELRCVLYREYLSRNLL